MLYISHNLGLVRETCDRITVMYAGEAVEAGSVASVFRRMRHPYTRGLFASMPVAGADKQSRPLAAIPGQLPPPGVTARRMCPSGRGARFFVAGRCDSGRVPMLRRRAWPRISLPASR